VRLGDEAVMLDAAVLLEIEDGATEIVAELEIEGRRDQFVLLAQRLRRDLAGRRDDRRAGRSMPNPSSAPHLAAANTQAAFW